MIDSMGVLTTGIGSWPGSAMVDALKISFAECPDLPFLPELPERGPHAGLIGRGTALLNGLGVELHATGWRLTDASGRDHRRAITTLRSDLDLLEEVAQGYSGPIKIAIAGPWTLGAAMEHPRGDKLLADPGARRDLGQSLLDGLAELTAELRRRLPEVSVIIQLDEPSLPAVLAGGIKTASGLARHRSIDVPEVSGTLTAMRERLETGGAETWLHCCAPLPPIELLHGAGIVAVLVDAEQLRSAEWDALGPAMEAGLRLGLGILPTGAIRSADELANRTLRLLRPLDLPPEITTRTVLTPACGLGGGTVEHGVRVLRALRTAAGIVTDQLAE
jgi:hypothetical protein